ncbi:MAG: hypothetical protein H7141_03830 [Burkholderiales bacterium]|nr:hypothetical protein [Bacteroidia bacterium]
MIKEILNTGISLSNDDNLNRKIRISNLISMITIITMIGFMPIATIYKKAGIIILNLIFLVSAFIYTVLKNMTRHFI